ncbi:hypothetical protein GCM10009787_55280 [Streptomyces bangladeshensis]|uniref:Uncharacterized protein n=1 Tax=Streptomyces bangladeshensis TaxID=295352 RepID=A0ABN3BWD6_9ACTN
MQLLVLYELVMTHPVGMGDWEHTEAELNPLVSAMVYQTPVAQPLPRYELVMTQSAGMAASEQTFALPATR